LVAGKNRVPMPATGKTAFVTFLFIYCPCTCLSRAPITFSGINRSIWRESESV